MQRLLWLALVVLSACSGTPVPAPSTHAAAPDPWASRGSAGSAGSGEPIPKWASDPPHVLRDKVTGVNAHVIVLKSQPTFAEYRDVLDVVEKTPGVAAAEPFVFVELFISSAKHAPVSIALKGVDPARVGRVLALPANMKEGTVASLAAGEPPSIILGDDLAKKLGVKLGDEVTLSAPPDASFAPKAFRVSGTFHADFDEYDERLSYASLSAAQAMLGRGDHVLGIELTVHDLDTSPAVAKAIDTTLGGPPYAVMDWYELNKTLFVALFGNRRP